MDMAGGYMGIRTNYDSLVISFIYGHGIWDLSQRQRLLMRSNNNNNNNSQHIFLGYLSIATRCVDIVGGRFLDFS